MSNSIPFVYFGTPKISARLLNILAENGLTPSLVVTAPDRPQGRGQNISESAVAMWARERSIPALKPEKIDEDFMDSLQGQAPEGGWSLFIVFAYGHILPKELIYLPKHNTLNLHPSLLPRLRGPAPIRSAILEADETGVSIIEIDEQMDHGPIVAQESVQTDSWPLAYPVLEELLIKTGGRLLAETVPLWVAGEIEATPQDDKQATYSRKFAASDGEIDLNADAEENLRKICAFTDWPKAHFFADGQRILIKKAHLKKGELIIDTVQPAGDTAMPYEDFKRRQ